MRSTGNDDSQDTADYHEGHATSRLQNSVFMDHGGIHIQRIDNKHTSVDSTILLLPYIGECAPPKGGFRLSS